LHAVLTDSWDSNPYQFRSGKLVGRDSTKRKVAVGDLKKEISYRQKVEDRKKTKPIRARSSFMKEESNAREAKGRGGE